MSRMPPVPDSSARPAERAVVNDYDSFAEEYSAGNEASLINGYYTRPAVLDLAGDVAGLADPRCRWRLRPPVRRAARPRCHHDRLRLQR